MALRGLTMKMRVPAAAAAAPRLPSTRVTPTSGSRVLPFSTLSREHLPREVAVDWYMLQRNRYDDVTRELKNLRRIVSWTERLAKLLNRFYMVGLPFAAGFVVLERNAYQKRENDILEKKKRENDIPEKKKRENVSG